MDGNFNDKNPTSSAKALIQMGNPIDAEVFWNEKNMASLVNCCEDCIDGELTVSYVKGYFVLNEL